MRYFQLELKQDDIRGNLSMKEFAIFVYQMLYNVEIECHFSFLNNSNYQSFRTELFYDIGYNPTYSVSFSYCQLYQNKLLNTYLI